MLSDETEMMNTNGEPTDKPGTTVQDKPGTTVQPFFFLNLFFSHTLPLSSEV